VSEIGCYAQEWEQRLAASRKATQLLASAIALMKEGSDEPAPRNELRKFVLNPSFYQARLMIREAKVGFFAFMESIGTKLQPFIMAFFFPAISSLRV
jgi:hypothetical protein